MSLPKHLQDKINELALKEADGIADYKAGASAMHYLMLEEMRPIVEALEFYSREENWYANGAISLFNHIVDDDLSQDDMLRWVRKYGGKRARQAIEIYRTRIEGKYE